jgi:hypothetical protein
MVDSSTGTASFSIWIESSGTAEIITFTQTTTTLTVTGCLIIAPDNGSMGDCPELLQKNSTCTPDCDRGYGGGFFVCSEGGILTSTECVPVVVTRPLQNLGSVRTASTAALASASLALLAAVGAVAAVSASSVVVKVQGASRKGLANRAGALKDLKAGQLKAPTAPDGKTSVLATVERQMSVRGTYVQKGANGKEWVVTTPVCDLGVLVGRPPQRLTLRQRGGDRPEPIRVSLTGERCWVLLDSRASR